MELDSEDKITIIPQKKKKKKKNKQNTYFKKHSDCIEIDS